MSIHISCPSDSNKNLTKWMNPFSKYDNSDELYERYIRSSNLYDSLTDFNGKIIVCNCTKNKCHSKVIIKLLKEKQEDKENIYLSYLCGIFI